MIHVRDLRKNFGDFCALDGLNLHVEEGKVLGLLGPNGAGKTTAVRILATLLQPDSGDVIVAGHSVVNDPEAVRRSIGLSGQYAAVDEKLTGHENLYMVGRLYGMGRRAASQRADELLASFRLTDVAGKRAGSYSGGMRRRLDLAGAIVARPKVVILDEPTTGLDPRGRLDTWEVIASLVGDGTTVLLTTQYLDEADHLADHIAVLDDGRVIAEGTASDLKARVGSGRIDVIVGEFADLDSAAQILSSVAGITAEPEIDRTARRVSVAAPDGHPALVRALSDLDGAGTPIIEAALRRPTLDDVFFELTGRPAETVTSPDESSAEDSATSTGKEGARV